MRRFVIVCLIAIMIVGAILICVKTFEQPKIVAYEKYVVHSGDTLWDIAKESNGWTKMDTYDIIYAIEEASNCTAHIYPGQIVYIPIYDID